MKMEMIGKFLYLFGIIIAVLGQEGKDHNFIISMGTSSSMGTLRLKIEGKEGGYHGYGNLCGTPLHP